MKNRFKSHYLYIIARLKISIKATERLLGFTREFSKFTSCKGYLCLLLLSASVVSNSVRPHRRQPTRLPHPWDSPGKNTRVGCHFLLQCMIMKSEREVAQSCPTLIDPKDCSPPGSSIHGIFQARVLEWGAIAFLGKKKILCTIATSTKNR